MGGVGDHVHTEDRKCIVLHVIGIACNDQHLTGMTPTPRGHNHNYTPQQQQHTQIF